MRLRAALSAVVVGLLLSLGAGAQNAERPAERLKVVAYVPTWIDVAAFAQLMDYPKITHVNVAFANPTNDDGDLRFIDKVKPLVSKAHEHGVKVLVSIGGGAASGNKELLARYARLLKDGRRPAFVKKLADYVAAHDFDGLDVDLEGPSINGDYGAFVAELAGALKPPNKLLTAALSKGYGGAKVPASVFEHFDFVNIMAYDGAGPWNPDAPGQHSSMEFARDNAAYWLGRGLPKSKAVLGVPFYGYGFGDAFRKRDYPYSQIVAAHSGAEHDDQAGTTIWYNGIPTIRAKARYVVDQDLAGVMIWSLDYDVKGERSLLSAIHEVLQASRGEH
jgi:GH18 family chitinase